jgi:hypothetical protein
MGHKMFVTKVGPPSLQRYFVVVRCSHRGGHCGLSVPVDALINLELQPLINDTHLLCLSTRVHLRARADET